MQKLTAETANSSPRETQLITRATTPNRHTLGRERKWEVYLTSSNFHVQKQLNPLQKERYLRQKIWQFIQHTKICRSILKNSISCKGGRIEEESKGNHQHTYMDRLQKQLKSDAAKFLKSCWTILSDPKRTQDIQYQELIQRVCVIMCKDST